MKPGAAFIIVLGVSAIGAGAYFVYSANKYAEAVDARIERELGEADLTIIRAQLHDLGGDPAAQLRNLYRGAMNEELNIRYARLIAGWHQAYPRLARIQMIREPLSETQRLALEVDERLGRGAFAVMADEYQRYLREAPQRAAMRRTLEEQARAEAERVNRYIEDYMRRHGKFPDEIPLSP
jgi:hypothetical protein